jgi:hypothetical protein
MVGNKGSYDMSILSNMSVRQYCLLGVILLCAFSCTNFLTPFENVVENQKIRPFAVVCDPPEAAPGDTVSVRLYYYDPPGDLPTIHWLISLNYGTDLNGSEYEKDVVNLDSMMLPGSTPDTFRFKVPDSEFFYSTQIVEMVGNPLTNPLHLTIAAIDSQLRFAAQTGITSPQLIALADNFSCKLKLRAQMRADISLDVTMLLRVRYSDKLKSPNVNKNPTIDWMGIIKVPQANFNNIDSLSTTPYKFQYLYNYAHPDSVNDTVIIDSGCTYFVVADSGGSDSRSPRQIYTYFSTQDNAMIVDTETYNYSWFYTNLDYNAGMVMDSLLLFGEGRSRSMRQLLPPVDTAMHRFTLYLTIRDERRPDAGATPGEAFKSVNGYFSYTAAYARHTTRSARGG